MRLINTTTLELHEFFDSNIPPYAILSHRWENGEINFKDYTKGRNKDSAGYMKVLRFVEKAAQDRFEWAWIDTCCIDKKSSAELSEAINSMFRWYENTQVCYVYLSDVHCTTDGNRSPTMSGFDTSKWFTRGWTLQELLAPAHVEFLDCEWKTFGTKETMAEKISAITGIRQEHLVHGVNLHSICVAEKMSWASNRRTSRAEDVAYCLMGIFNINMPLLYGEGRKAFLRLQQEIVRVSYDMSIFAWDQPNNRTRSVFASSPAGFSTSGGIRLVREGAVIPSLAEKLHNDLVTSYATTNKGLQIDADVCKSLWPHSEANYPMLSDDKWLWLLSCGKFQTAKNGEPENRLCAVLLHRNFWATKGSLWLRAEEKLVFLDANTVLRNYGNLQRETICINI
jgi:Heterokaryon incompatibility protein (HET)